MPTDLDDLGVVLMSSEEIPWTPFNLETEIKTTLVHIVDKLQIIKVLQKYLKNLNDEQWECSCWQGFQNFPPHHVHPPNLQ